ncbi:BRCT domain-containing protein, partial [Suillus americanus]
SGPSRESGTVRVMTTGIQLTDDTIKRLNKLGAKMTTKPNDCTHLVTKGIVRTEKFLCAMASSPFVLTEGWVNSSVRTGKLLPETDFLISDPESERKWDFKLSASLERAKRQDGGEGLLKGMSFYVTPKVEIDLKLLKAVITSAGGQVQTSKPTARILKANKNRHVISCPADQSIWRPLVEEGYTIYSTELILLAVLTQEIRWKDDNCISSKPSL